jgi:beta-lactamase class A
MFKLFVLGALARQVAVGRISWDQEQAAFELVR